ncbi:MAG TPA: hypothetical protein VKB52_12145 [Rhodanobacteraceae bacterium]|nr:hypothetical protein [Rhodanobacteraceae bacterium]
MDKTLRFLLLGAGSLLAFPAGAANLVGNPDFVSIDGWSVMDGDGNATLDTTDGSPAAPSLHVVTGTTVNTSVQSDCIAVDDSNNVDLYFNLNGTTGSASVLINTYGDAACTTGLAALGSDSFPATNSWITYSTSDVMLPDGTQSVRIVLVTSQTASGGQGEANFDHILFGPTGTVIGAVDINQEGLGGSWYNPATSGQGMQFQFTPDDSNPGEGSLFGAWYTYDIAAGTESSQRWYSVQSAITGDAQSVAVTIYQNTGGNFDAPPDTSAVAVGTGTLSFDTCTTGTFSYTFNDGRAGTIPLQRLLPNVSCVESGTPANPVSDFGFSGAWYDTGTSGQGMLVEVNPNDAEVFIGWYTYAMSGEAAGAAGQRWFSAQAPYTVGTRVMDLTVYASTGGIFDSSGGVTTTPVGTATLTFASCTTGTLDYAFTAGELDGQSGSIPLTRLGATPASCNFTNN